MADVVTCPSCGSENETGRKLCGECGNATGDTERLEEARRIFEDLRSTPWLERLEARESLQVPASSQRPRSGLASLA